MRAKTKARWSLVISLEMEEVASVLANLINKMAVFVVSKFQAKSIA